jgi:hypothetical protein
MKSLILACTEDAKKMLSPWAQYRDWDIISTQNQFMQSRGYDYKTIYAVHWHWRIPMTRHKVIGFHMTDLPFGRGPRPWERLKRHIDANRHHLGQSRETIVTGFLIDTGLDTGIDTGIVLIKRIINITDDKKETLRLAYQACKEMIEILDTWGPTMWIPQELYGNRNDTRSP